jgi:hypothetical protein
MTFSIIFRPLIYKAFSEKSLFESTGLTNRRMPALQRCAQLCTKLSTAFAPDEIRL